MGHNKIECYRKHSYAWLSIKCDYRTDRYTHTQTDAGQSDPYVPLCFAGDTITGTAVYVSVQKIFP